MATPCNLLKHTLQTTCLCHTLMCILSMADAGRQVVQHRIHHNIYTYVYT